MPNWERLSPTTGATWLKLESRVLEAISEIDQKQLEIDRSTLPQDLADELVQPLMSARHLFGHWEELVIELESEWKRGYYSPDFYVHVLGLRNDIEEILGIIDTTTSSKLGTLVQGLDDRFMAKTEFDAGKEVHTWIKCKPEWCVGWWWHRRPLIPWD